MPRPPADPRLTVRSTPTTACVVNEWPFGACRHHERPVAKQSPRCPCPPGLSREQAAAYVGVSPSLFDMLIKDRRMPGPKRVNSRVVWDRLRLDLAFEALAETNAGTADDEWKRVPMRGAPDMPRRLPPGCVEDRDRHGNIRIYYRAKGRPKIWPRGTPWTPDFMTQLDQAKGKRRGAERHGGITQGTWRWLCTRYFGECSDYLRLDQRTQTCSPRYR